jgi:hypothetical protein
MMKKFAYIFFFFLIASCEDVVDIDVPEAQPRLVIEASINWFKGTSGNQQEVKLSLSAPYFNSEIPPATGAHVSITDINDNMFEFTESQPGLYQNNTFIPEINGRYYLTIVYQGDIYTASETLKSVAEIENIEQIDDSGLTGEETEIKAYYTDPADEVNYNFFEFINENDAYPSLEVYKDEFVNGNQIFGYHSDEDIEQGDELTIRNYGVSERFYQFIYVLLEQNSDDSGGPFETQPATVRGNCINETKPDYYPLGYFRVSEVDEYVYTIQ